MEQPQNPYKRLKNLFLRPEEGTNRIRSVEYVSKYIFGSKNLALCEQIKKMMRRFKKEINEKLDLDDDEVSLYKRDLLIMCTVLQKDVSLRGNNEIYGWVLHDAFYRENICRDINGNPCVINEIKRWKEIYSKWRKK